MAEQLALTRQPGTAVPNPNRTVRQQVPAFLNKLYRCAGCGALIQSNNPPSSSMVNDPVTDELIRWSDEGDSFLVPNHERFGRELLPRFFKHGNFSSFVRQLNMYGFHKVPHLQQGVLQNETETELWQFVNPHFQRGQPDLLILIQRKKSANNPNSAGDEEGSTAVAGPSSATTTGPVDLGTIAGGLATIKRHQSIISAELKDLQQSNTALWQEAVAARERHKKHQDTINRILKFLAGVFGNNLSAQSVPHSPGSHNAVVPAVPRKRPRLMIQDADRSMETPSKGKKRYLDEDEEDDDLVTMDMDEREHVEPRIAELVTPVEASPALTAARIESVATTPAATADDIRSPRNNTAIARRQPRATNSSKPDALSTVTPLSSNMLNVPESSTFPTQTQTSTPSYLHPQSMALNPYFTATQGYSSTPPSGANSNTLSSSLNSDPTAFQGLLNSPGSLQRMLNALSQPQGIPAIPTMPPSYDNDSYVASLGPYPDPMALSQESAAGGLSANLFGANGAGLDESMSGSSLTPESMLALFNSFQPSTTNDMQLLNDGTQSYQLDSGNLGQSVGAQANDLRRVYKDAATINADVDAIQQSISSLIQSIGLDPNSMANLHEDESSTGAMQDRGLLDGESSAVDFDALLNQFSHGTVPDMMNGDNLSGVDFPFDLDQEQSSFHDPTIRANNMAGPPNFVEDPPPRLSAEENTASTVSSPSQSTSGDNVYSSEQTASTPSGSKNRSGKRKSDVAGVDSGVMITATSGQKKSGKTKKRK